MNVKTVAVAMSGGVDSSVAAVLLAQQGFRVIGLTMKLWDYEQVGGLPDRPSTCCNTELVENARAVCARFNLPHYVLNLAQDFEETVIADFVEEYKHGRTPNPCVVCNTRIKWDVLLRKAQTLGADFLATGHYAQVEFYPKSNRWTLKKGLDQKRDQSYFLWGLNQQALSRTLFPLGKMTKQRVRELAAEMNLRAAETPESREICFITDDNYRRFLKEYARLEPRPGPIVDESGQVVGEHAGVANYTIGQRRGLNLALGHRVYVRKIDPANNTIHIAANESMLVKQFVVSQVNFVSINGSPRDLDCQVKIRYSSRLYPAHLSVRENNICLISLDEPVAAVTPGQSAVFYYQDVVLAGGIIEEVL